MGVWVCVRCCLAAWYLIPQKCSFDCLLQTSICWHVYTQECAFNFLSGGSYQSLISIQNTHLPLLCSLTCGELASLRGGYRRVEVVSTNHRHRPVWAVYTPHTPHTTHTHIPYKFIRLQIVFNWNNPCEMSGIIRT